jgi:thiol-disulfide isomerase/thioredoxin
MLVFTTPLVGSIVGLGLSPWSWLTNVSWLTVYFALIAGGRDPVSNDQSHQEHLLSFVSLLDQRDIPNQQITIFWADGSSTAADRRLPDSKEEKLNWVVDKTPWQGWFERPPLLANTEWDGLTTYEAKRKALRRWLRQLAPKLKPNDSVVFVVTDHGAPDPQGEWRTSIELWGEQLNVDQLYQDLQILPSNIHIQLWMSQCYSGGFARLAAMDSRVCGAFSATAHRAAYGCFSLSTKRKLVGHFALMNQGLKRNGRLDLASRWASERDETPDTPHLSSDAFASRIVRERSEALGIPQGHIVDGALPQLNRLNKSHQELAQSITRIALRFNLGLVQSYSHARQLLKEVHDLEYTLETWRAQWESLTVAARLRLLNRAPVEGFTPKLSKRSQRRGRAKLKRWIKRALRRGKEGRRGLLRDLYQRLQRAERILDQLKSFEAALLRISTLYTGIAAEGLLTPHDLKIWRGMKTCEARPLFSAPPPSGDAKGRLNDTTCVSPVFSTLSELRTEVDALRPGHLAFQYRERSKARAIEVREIGYGSPLWDVDLQPKDRIDTVEGERLSYSGQVRELVALHPVGELLKIKRKRGRKSRTIHSPVVGMPISHPPPQRGDPVPPLVLDPIEGERFDYLMTGGRPTLLYFWATWCQECIRVASQVKRWAQRHDLQVLAITTEDPYLVKAVNSNSPLPFPLLHDRGHEVSRLFRVNLQNVRAPVFIYIDVERRFIERGIGLGDRGPKNIELLFD